MCCGKSCSMKVVESSTLALADHPVEVWKGEVMNGLEQEERRAIDGKDKGKSKNT